MSQIFDMDDLADRLGVMETIVRDLKEPLLSPAELEVLLNQYIHLEDSIVSGIEYLSRNIRLISEKQELDELTEIFNTLGSDFQDTWKDSYWELYESIREGTAATQVNLTVKVSNLQDLAIVLNKPVPKKQKKKQKKISSRALEELDELSKKFKPGSCQDPVNRKCCNCTII